MNNKLLEAGKHLILLVITILVASSSIIYIYNFYKEPQSGKEPISTIPPVIDECPDAINCSQNNEVASTSMISLITTHDNYKIPSNPYDQVIYKSISKRLALIGDFEIARIKIKGNLPTDDPHFVSLNLNSVSGVYNAVRNSSDSLDIPLSDANLGVFTKTSGINIALDLLSKTSLATTKEEFLSTRETTKLTRFWDFIKPEPPAPNISRILVAPFNKDGLYTGAIESMTFEFVCKKGETCNAALCPENELATVCIKNKFGEKAANEWLNWFKSNK